MIRLLTARTNARQFGADFATAWRSQAPWGARSRALALTLALLAWAAAPANGQHRDETPPAKTAASNPVDAALRQASARFAIPRDWITTVMQAESGGNANAVSVKGALGLMQVMPATWQEWRARLQLGGNAFDPHDNILVGAAYLKQMLDRYGTSGFLAAYNAGPGRYDDHLATGRPLPEETQKYMARLATVLHLQQPGSSKTLAHDSRLAIFIDRTTDITSVTSSPTSNPNSTRPPHQTFALAPQSQGIFVDVTSDGIAP